MSMVMADKELSQAITVYQDLEHQQQMIAASEAIIAELEAVLGNASGIGGFDALRYDLQLNRSLAVQRHFELLALEESVLDDALSGESKRQIAAITAQRETAQSTALTAAAEGDYDRVERDISGLRSSLGALRRASLDSSSSSMLGKIDGMHSSLERADLILAQAGDRIGPLELEELGRIRERFDLEVANVVRQRGELTETLTRAEDVSIALTRSGFGRLEDFFAASVLRADVGIVDVYWAQKVEVSDEKTRVIEERNALRDQISRRFELIEQKLRL
jgi:hypothetical protein